MSDEYWQGEWPNLASVSVRLPTYVNYAASPTSVGILYLLVMHIATKSVHTAYQNPSPDPHFLEQDICRIAKCGRGEWKNAKEFVSEFFVVTGKIWRLGEQDLIRYSRPLARDQIAAAAKMMVMARDGQRCVYCGTLEGPFHFDHLFPFSKGGTNSPSNLVFACAPCNLSKRDMTLRQWMESMR